MDKEFSFVIARPWYKNDPNNLCIYAYGSEVLRGNMQEAKRMLAYVHTRSSEAYGIYKVNFEKVD